MNKKATLLLPNGIGIDLEEFDLDLGGLIALVQENFDDSKIAPESFGALKYFFFVNSSRGTLIDSNLDLGRTLSTLAVNDRDVVELRLCKPKPQPDGTVLNPMWGVTKYVK